MKLPSGLRCTVQIQAANLMLARHHVVAEHRHAVEIATALHSYTSHLQEMCAMSQLKRQRAVSLTFREAEPCRDTQGQLWEMNMHLVLKLSVS